MSFALSSNPFLAARLFDSSFGVQRLNQGRLSLANGAGNRGSTSVLQSADKAGELATGSLGFQWDAVGTWLEALKELRKQNLSGFNTFGGSSFNAVG